MDDVEELGREIAAAERVVALTGAGISQPSGVPTFREEGGVWDRFDRRDFHYDRFRRDPAGFWRDRLELHEAMFDGEYEPNAAHEALATLGREGPLEAIVTQNTDGLHARAGRSPAEDGGPGDAADASAAEGAELLELHGNAHRAVCTECDRRVGAAAVFDRVREGELPPRCDCGGPLKPDVVLFGEQLPGAAMQRARGLARECDVFLAIGSSLVVEPAASLPRTAAGNGATVAVVNLEETPCDSVADYVLRASVTEVLPRLAERGTGSSA